VQPVARAESSRFNLGLEKLDSNLGLSEKALYNWNWNENDDMWLMAKYKFWLKLER